MLPAISLSDRSQSISPALLKFPDSRKPLKVLYLHLGSSVYPQRGGSSAAFASLVAAGGVPLKSGHPLVTHVQTGNTARLHQLLEHIRGGLGLRRWGLCASALLRRRRGGLLR